MARKKQISLNRKAQIESVRKQKVRKKRKIKRKKLRALKVRVRMKKGKNGRMRMEEREYNRNSKENTDTFMGNHTSSYVLAHGTIKTEQLLRLTTNIHYT